MKLIDKSAVIAEIKGYKDSFCDRNGYLEDNETNGLAYDTLCELEDSIDTLGVKEVNLEKEIETLDSLLYDLDGVAVKGATHYLTVEDVKDIAKYFYELGFAQKGGRL